MADDAETRRFPTIFDNSLHDCRFQPGKDGKHAVLSSWIDAIALHKKASEKEQKVRGRV
jgi:hypothetical protein